MKIDTSKFENFDSMTADQKLAAIMAYDFDDNSDALAKANSEVERYKNSNTSALSKLAEMTRKYNAKLTDEERAKEQHDQEIADMRNQLSELQTEKTISDTVKSYIGMGYPEELALASAKALQAGDMSTVFANQKLFMVEHDKQMAAQRLKDMPTPPAGSGAQVNVDKAKFLAMSSDDQAKYVAEHPNCLNELK